MSRESAAQPSMSPCPVPAAQGTRRANHARTWRKLWLDVHLYLGLTVGLVLAVAGLTGSLLVFWLEVDEWLNPALLTVAPPTGEPNMRPLHEILTAAERAAWPGSHVTQFYGPPHPNAVFMVYTELPSKAWQQVYVDPYRAQVTGVRDHAADEWVPNSLIEAVFRLHFALFLGDNGTMLVAMCALLLLVSLVSGLMVWWPLTGRWRQAFAIRRPTNAVRLTFDLHKTFSLYTCVVVGAVLLSGVYMNLNEPFVQLTKFFSPATRGPQDVPQSVPQREAVPIGVERAVVFATAQYPGGLLGSVVLPEDERGAYQVGRREVPGVSGFWSERLVWVDQYSGAILDVRDPTTRRSAGETFLDWQWPLHSGQAFGWPGRLLVFVSGLACPVVYATGLLMWRRKRKARQKRVTAVPC